MSTERKMTAEEISALNLPIQVTREELLQIVSDMRNPDLPNDESPTLIKVVDRSLSK